jgi:hypothetical protein
MGLNSASDLAAGTPVYHTGTPNDDWHWAALICAVGEHRDLLDDPQCQVEVGLKRGFTVDSDGYLYFLANDNRALPNGTDGYADNRGIIHVKVTVTDPPNSSEGSGNEKSSPTPGPSDTPAASPAAVPINSAATGRKSAEAPSPER